MKVLFDYQIFEMQNMGGVSRSFVELCGKLGDQSVITQIGIRETDNVHLKDSALVPKLKPLHYTHDMVFGKKQSFKGQWIMTHALVSLFGQNGDYWDINRRLSIELLKKQDFDVFHPTFFDTYFLPYLKNRPFILTIHDMIPELYPQYFGRDDSQIIGKTILAPLASAIVAVSEKTKEDIVRILHIPEEKVHVIHHGCSFTKPKEIKRLLPSPYILYVGGRYGYKNFESFVQKSASLFNNHDGLKLVCTGQPFSSHESALFDSLGIRDRIVHYWVKNDDEFYSLYHFAELFVYPSEYEGFGIPILEAYAADCPVLLYDASCFPEIAGDAAVYFTFDNLSEQIEKILGFTSIERERLLEKQRTRLQLYSWEKSAIQLEYVYKTVLE